MHRVFPLLFAALAALLALASAAVYDAAAGVEAGLRAARRAALITVQPGRDSALAAAAAELNARWSRPTLWHAGAMEMVSYVESRRALEGGAPATAAAMTARSVSAAPLQPAAWTRLAALAAKGARTPCGVAECLAKSWRAAAIVDQRLACTRLRLAHEAGLLRADDPRVDAYLASGYRRAEIAQCLSFLPPATLFRALMRRARAEAEAG